MSAQPNFVNLATLLGIPQAALDELFYQFDADLRVCVPAIVNSFDATTQLAEVQIAIQENVFLNLGITPVSIKPLQMVQVGMFRAGGFSITFPVEAGDEGVVIFNDLCINAWKKSGGTQNNQEERRRHDLSDGIFYPMAWSQARKLSGYSTSALQIQSDDGTTSISVSEGSIVLTPDGGTTELSIVPGVITAKTASFVVNAPVTFDQPVTFNEAVTMDSTLDVTNDVTAADFISGTIGLTTHQHGGVQNGSGVTGGPFG
jgi:Phage protein Gp138 N-terminal domain